MDQGGGYVGSAVFDRETLARPDVVAFCRPPHQDLVINAISALFVQAVGLHTKFLMAARRTWSSPQLCDELLPSLL
jgi:hypothetical protein